ncbi:immunoglobulin domain-containing protein [Aquabacterium sp.]|uniref:immunoglobulin domain-containing protein n=1 Tax=Aquabacterium sp. TaxID=1872578 RepID=UPI002B9225E0|nr:hypothetical protein [Aquabacterium sp.]HSW05282.1 hypothetical protein [Aquabacterium sp.]
MIANPIPAPATGLAARSTRLLALSVAMALIAGCGGGGGSAEVPAPPPPTPSPPPAPTLAISAQPANQAVITGQSARFSISATGSGSLSYQWRLNGVDVSGATASSFVPKALDTGQDNAQVSVRVGDANGSLMSAAATLRVYSPANVPAATLNPLVPSFSDTSIDDSVGSHLAAVNAAVASQGRLFVFFPASGSVPTQTQLLLNAAANNGFHVLGLAYPNDVVVSLLCSRSSDPNCLGNAREEIRTGADVSSGITVSPGNSIENRIVKALRYLRLQQPGQGWDQFLDSNNAVRWELLRLSGHSQGGGHAAYLATQHAVDRACYFSSPADYDNVRDAPATWITATGPTPGSRMYGFAHQRDPIVPFKEVVPIWTAFGMAGFGAATLIDGASPADYQGRHMLYTNVGDLSFSNHGVTVTDGATPLDASTGVPVFMPIWQYSCFL